MKKIIACAVALILLVSLCVPAMAAETEFTPSVTNKPAPGIKPVPNPDGDDAIALLRDKDGKIVGYITEDCLVITSVSEAKQGKGRIPEDARDLLLKVYDELMNGKMTLPYEKVDPSLNSGNMVIRDLFDASFLCDDHPALLGKDGYTLETTFTLGVKPGVKVVVMAYIDGKWEPVDARNNGDGTVTCVFDAICPIAFSVPVGDAPSAETGELINYSWLILALGSLAAIAVLTVIYRMDANKRAA